MLIQKQDVVELTVGTHSKKWTDAELVYPVEEQELAAGHKGLRYLDNIVRGCDVHIKTNHLNNTFNEPGGQNMRVRRQMVKLDGKYGVTFKHLAGVLNTGASGLSRNKILDEIPDSAYKQLAEASTLDRDADNSYPVSIQQIQDVQEKGDDLRKAIVSDKKGCFFLDQMTSMV